MKKQKTGLKIMTALIVVGVILVLNLQVNAGSNYIPPTPNQDVASYLRSRLTQRHVPFTKIEILQASPLQIEINIQSMSNNKDWMPEDFENLILARREAVLAGEKGFNIERYTEVLVNQNGESISWARIKINGEISYTKLAPSTVADLLTKNLVMEKIGTHGMSIINNEVSSFDGFQTLNIALSAKSLEEANLVLPQIRESFRPSAKDINSHGSQIVMIKLVVKNELGEILLNYLLDLQFGTENWWVAEGINVDNWYPSIPAPAP